MQVVQVELVPLGVVLPGTIGGQLCKSVVSTSKSVVAAVVVASRAIM